MERSTTVQMFIALNMMRQLARVQRETGSLLVLCRQSHGWIVLPFLLVVCIWLIIPLPQ